MNGNLLNTTVVKKLAMKRRNAEKKKHAEQADVAATRALPQAPTYPTGQPEGGTTTAQIENPTPPQAHATHASN